MLAAAAAAAADWLLSMAAAAAELLSVVERLVWVLRCWSNSSAELCRFPQYPSRPFIQLQIYGPPGPARAEGAAEADPLLPLEVVVGAAWWWCMPEAAMLLSF